MSSLVNREAVQKLCAASYMEEYLDCMQNLPNQIQPHLSRIRELDIDTRRCLAQIEQYKAQLRGKRRGNHDVVEGLDSESERRNNRIFQSCKSVIDELGDILIQKYVSAQKMEEIIENRRRNLDESFDNLRNCDRADSSLFSPNRSKTSQLPKSVSVGGSTSPSTSYTNENGRSVMESEESIGSGQRVESDNEESISQNQSSSESDNDTRASDNTDTRRSRIGRPSRFRQEISSRNKSKANRPKEFPRQNKLNRTSRQDRPSRHGKGVERIRSSRGGSARSANSTRISRQNSNYGGSSTASFDIAENIDNETDEQLYCVCKQVSFMRRSYF